jgi:hypothetical protein
MPSSIPLGENTSLLDTGQVGDLYLYSREIGLPHENLAQITILWLCIKPAVAGGQALWAQVQLAGTFGG